MKHLTSAFFVLLVILAPLVGATAAEDLKITDTEIGTGETAKAMDKVSVHYTGWLASDDTKFDSSRDRGTPLSFTLGAGMVIPGWEQGILGMKVGGKRELIIPPHLAYGEQGAGGAIPPRSTLRFEVELVGITPPKYTNIDNAQLKELMAKGVKLIDVRHPHEWQETGVIEGSIMMESFKPTGRLRREFIQELAETVKKDEPVILICRTGNRTNLLSEGLSESFGYTNIYNVTKGITQWIADGNPVVKP